jgi:hypothetical protein
MKDCRTPLVTGLITAIAAKATGLTPYTKVPKGDFNNPIAYPFYYITNITDIEDGPKNQFMYSYDLDIEVVFADLTTKETMWTAVNSIKEIINNCVPFTITGGFEIMSMTLISTDETEDLLNSQDVDTTIIRVNFQIEDNN